MAISKIPSAGFQDNVKFRNIIINGDMSIAQRGTSASSHSSDSYTTVDRWKTRVNGQGVWTISQETDVPSGQGFANSLKWDCTTADASPSASDFLIHEQKFEGQNLQYLKYGTANAESLTVSFWVKSNKIGAYTIGFFCAGNNKHIESSYTINNANTWEKKTVTFVGDTASALANDNTEEMKLWFWLGAGSNFSSGTHATTWSSYAQANVLVDNQVNLADNTSNEWYITGVQLEAGTTASDFEFLPVDVNTQRCERYYQVIVDGAGVTWGIATQYTTATIYASYLLRTVMRTAPTLDQVTGTNIYTFYRNSNADTFNGITVLQKATPQYIEWNVSSGVSGTGGQAGFLRTGNSATTAFIGVNAEL